MNLPLNENQKKKTFFSFFMDKYNKYYYKKVKCIYCNRSFLRDKRFHICKEYVCSEQCFLNYKSINLPLNENQIK